MYTQKKTTSFPSQDIFKMPTWMWLATSNGALPFNLERPQVQHWNSLKVKFPPKFLSSCRSIKTLTFQESLGFRKKKIYGGGKMWNILGLYHADISCRVRYTLAFSPKALLQLRRRPTAWMAWWRFCHATLTTAKNSWSLLLRCYYYSNVYNVLLAIINYNLFTISIYTKISEGHLML